MKSELDLFIEKYDPDWIYQFISDNFGKFDIYVHTLSRKGLNCYFSNIREVSQFHPDDIGCVQFFIRKNYFNGDQEEEWVSYMNMVDYKDEAVFINALKKHLELKAFI